MGLALLLLAVFNGVVAKWAFDDALDAASRGWFGWVVILVGVCAINVLASALLIADGLTALFG